MFSNLLFLILWADLLLQSNANLYVSGSDDQCIKIWNGSSLKVSRNISKSINKLEIDFKRNCIITGTKDGKLVNWNYISNLTITDNGNETSTVNSILLINGSCCVSGYNNLIIFWSLPELRQIKKLSDSKFGNIGEMKYLESHNIILMVNKQKNMIVFSLKNDSIIKVNSIKEEGYSFDILNSSFIFSPCGFSGEDDVCLFSLKSDYSLQQTNIHNVRKSLTLPALKIINESFGIFSTSDARLVYVKTEPLTKNYTYQNIFNTILSLDISDSQIIAGHQNGSISFFDKNSFKLIKTFQGHKSTSSVNVIKSFSYEKFLLTSTISSTTNFMDKTSTNLIMSNEITTIIFRNSMTTTDSLISNLSTFILTSSTKGIETSFENQNKQNFNLKEMSLDRILEYLSREIDMSNCILNCSGNGICKLIDNIKLICECFDNYTGSKCDIKILPCSSNPCRNNGNCVDNLQNKTYTCECYSKDNQTSLYYGNNCEYKIDLCRNENCNKNGVCNDFGNEAKCKCFPYFNGTKCEIETNEIKIIKLVISTASIIAIIVLVITCSIIICFDFSKLFYKNKIPKRYKISHNRRPIHKFSKINLS